MTLIYKFVAENFVNYYIFTKPHYCKKLKTYVNPYRDGCEKWEKSDRKGYENDELYDQGKKYYNDDKPLGFYLFLLGLVLLICIIATLMQ